MSIRVVHIKLSIVLALTSVTLLTTSASGQSPAARPDSIDNGKNSSEENPVAAEKQ
jgi:hypothetical protein